MMRRRIKIIVQTKLMFCLILSTTPTESVHSQRKDSDNRKSAGNINGRYFYHQQNSPSDNYWYHWRYHNSGNSENNQRLQQSFPFSKDVGSNGNGFWNSGTSLNHQEKHEEKRNFFRLKNGFDGNFFTNRIHSSGIVTDGQPQANSYQHHQQLNKFNQRAEPYDHRPRPHWFTIFGQNNIFQTNITGGNKDHPVWPQWQQSDGRLSYDGQDDKVSSFERSGESPPNIRSLLSSSAEDDSSNLSDRGGKSTTVPTTAELPFLWIGAPPPPFISTLNSNGPPPHNRGGVYLESARPDSRSNNNDNSEDNNNNNIGSVVEPPVLDLTTPDQIDLLVEAQQFCGQDLDVGEDTDATLRIARGHGATKMYPWLVAIYKAASGKEMQFSCGGSLITSKHAISAAHCFLSSESPVQYEFIVSNNRILKQSEAAKTLRTADRIVLHPGYNPQAMSANADVAIVVFERPVQYGQFIRPICLWKGDYTNIRDVRNAIGKVVGWGANENVTIANDLPMEIDMNIVDYSTCILKDKTFINVIGENSFCTGNRDGSGPCMGDSGSGFMLQQDGRWSLRGVVSMTTELVGCDINHYVGITDVAKYQRWINTILRRRY